MTRLVRGLIDATTLNSATVTFDVTNFSRCGVQFIEESGTWITAVVEVQYSMDGDTWYSYSPTTQATGESTEVDIDVGGRSYIRGIITTSQGGACTIGLAVDVDVFAIPESSLVTDTDAIHDNVSGEIAAITEKASPISADIVVIEDSAASNVKKRVQIGNFPGGAAETVTLTVRKGSVGTIAKGTPVYISGYNVGGWTEVEEADADGSGTMPAIGIANEPITNSADAIAIVSGQVSGLATSAYSENDALYVSETVGTLTDVKPTGATSGIQSVARVTRSHISGGVIEVIGAGRTNDTQNLTQDKMWKGDANNLLKKLMLRAFVL